MDSDLIDNLEIYQEQLKQINESINLKADGSERDELIALRENIEELLALAGNDEVDASSAQITTNIDEEYALFQAEISKEYNNSDHEHNQVDENDLKKLEGMKCRAPHKHKWGDVVYHNAIVSSVVTKNVTNYEDVEVQILFTNPTHMEMAPCGYFLDGRCRKDSQNCKRSHGEIVAVSSLQDYIEPKFDLLAKGSFVLAKNTNNLWQRAVIRDLHDGKCVVQYESNQKEVELIMEHVFPLVDELGDAEMDESDSDFDNRDNLINMSLLNQPSDQALGNWEQYTKGIGSKLMQKMGYITGTGLGRCSDGRIEPVTAVILPSGKSLDYCMNLREKAGGDTNFFNADKKKLKKRKNCNKKKFNKKKVENKSEKGVFNFLNTKLCKVIKSDDDNNCGKSDRDSSIKNESTKNLNVASLKNVEDIKRVEMDLYKIRESLVRHKDGQSQMHKILKDKLSSKEGELRRLNQMSLNIATEQKRRSDKKKMTVF